MAGLKDKRGFIDKDRLDLSERQAVEYWMKRWGVTRDQIDLVGPHQASPGALQHMIRLCGFRSDRVVNIAEQVGNQIAASIPFALDLARRRDLFPG